MRAAWRAAIGGILAAVLVSGPSLGQTLPGLTDDDMHGPPADYATFTPDAVSFPEVGDSTSTLSLVSRLPASVMSTPLAGRDYLWCEWGFQCRWDTLFSPYRRAGEHYQHG